MHSVRQFSESERINRVKAWVIGVVQPSQNSCRQDSRFFKWALLFLGTSLLFFSDTGHSLSIVLQLDFSLRETQTVRWKNHWKNMWNCASACASCDSGDASSNHEALKKALGFSTVWFQISMLCIIAPHTTLTLLREMHQVYTKVSIFTRFQAFPSELFDDDVSSLRSCLDSMSVRISTSCDNLIGLHNTVSCSSIEWIFIAVFLFSTLKGQLASTTSAL